MKSATRAATFALFLAFGLLGVAPTGHTQGTVLEDNTIRLRTRSFTPATTITQELHAHLRGELSPRVHALVQFHDPLSKAQIVSLRQAGFLLVGYLGGSTYHLSLPTGTDLATSKLSRLMRYADIVSPADKVSPRLMRGEIDDWARGPDDTVKVLIDFFPDTAIGQARAALRMAGIEAEPYGAPNSWAATVARDRLKWLASLDAVRFIEPGPFPFFPLNSDSRRLTRTDGAQLQRYDTSKPTYEGLSGNGVRIGVSDSGGIDENHIDFYGVSEAGGQGPSRLYTIRAGSLDNHATASASVAAGSGLGSEGAARPAFSRRGHAPEAGLGDYPHFHGSRDLNYVAIVNDHTDVTYHSYAEGCLHRHITAASIDTIIRGSATNSQGKPIPARPQVWAAGNNQQNLPTGFCGERGYYSVFTTSKNSISVGSIDGSDGRLSEFSSIGPTFDGRVKPDLVAVGCYDSTQLEVGKAIGLELARRRSDGYDRFGNCGTSFAAPAVAGIVALLTEQHRRDSSDEITLLPSTYKAVLVQTAIDLVKPAAHKSGEVKNFDTDKPLLYHAGPDYATGHGLVDAKAAVSLMGDLERWREGVVEQTGFTNRWCIQVPPGSSEIRVTLAWDDEGANPAQAFDAPKLVNDLDLLLRQPANGFFETSFGKSYMPWVLEPLPFSGDEMGLSKDPISQEDVKPASRGEDRLNNVEVVSVPHPEPGTWLARVRAHSLPNGNIQPYSITSSHDFLREDRCRCIISPLTCVDPPSPF